MGLLRRAVVSATVFILASSFAIAQSASAAPWDYHTNMQVSTDRWNQGSAVHLTGSGFGSGESVKITLGSTALGSVPTSGGTFTDDIVIPQDTALGTYNLKATGNTTGAYSEYRFAVQPYNPWGEPSGYYVPVGTNLSFSGHRFANHEVVDTYFNGEVISSANTDTRGEFSHQGSFVVPASIANSTVPFEMRGRTSNTTAKFTVSIGGGGAGGNSNGGSGGDGGRPIPSQPSRPGSGNGQPPGSGGIVQPSGGNGSNGGNVNPTIPVTLLTSKTNAVLSDKSTWQSLSWKGGSPYDACNFQVTATSADGIGVEYPSDRSFTAPYKTSTLKANETDYTSLLLDVPASVRADAQLVLKATYQPCQNGTSVGGPVTQTHTITVPITPPEKADVVQTTSSASIDAGQGAWIPISFQGRAPGISNFNVRVLDSQGLGIGYPNYGTSSSLNSGGQLKENSSDFASIYVDTKSLPKATYVLSLAVSYGSPRVTVPTTLAIIVK